MNELAAGICFLLGSLFTLVGAVAMIRFPDIYTRLSGASKSGTVGIGLILLGLMVVDPRIATVFPVLMLGAFLVVTLPLSGHIIARVAYGRGERPTKATRKDALAEHGKLGGRHGETRS